MVNVNEASTWASTVGTETTITDKVANKHYDFYIDVSLLQSGESLELRLKMKILTGGTLKVKGYGVAIFPTTDKEVYRFPWESGPYQWRVTGKQVGGTTRNFDFLVLDA